MNKDDKKNLWLKLAESLCFITSNIAVLSFLSHHLTEAQLGTFSLISTFVYFFTTLTFGEALTKISTRELIQQGDERGGRIFVNSLLHVLINCTLLLSIFSFFRIGSYAVNDYSILFITLTFVALGNFLRIFESPIVSRGRLWMVTASHIFTDCFRIGLVYLLVANDQGFKQITLSNFAILYLSSTTLFLFISSQYFSKFNWGFSLSILKSVFFQALPLALMLLATRLYVRIDVLMIESYTGTEAVAHYAVAYSILDNLMIISGLLMEALFPGFSRYIFTDQAAFRRLYQGILSIFIKYLFPVAILITIFSKQLLGFIYGEIYADNFITVLFLMLAAMIAWINGPSGYIFIALGKQKIYMYGTILSFAMNVVLNFFLLPRMGADGAALATALTEVTICSWSLWFIYKHLGWLPFMKQNTHKQQP